MNTPDFSGCHRLTDQLLAGSIAEYAAPFTRAMLALLEANGVDYVLSLVNHSQFNAAGTGALSGSASDASPEFPVRKQAPVYLSYAFWPEGKNALPTARQVRRVLDEIDDFVSVGRTILLSGAGHPARAILAAGCWLGRHGPKERGSKAARELARLGWLGSARAATVSRATRAAWNFGGAGRAFVGAWPSGKEGEPVRTHLELLEADDVYPWATADYWLSVLPTVRVYPEGRQGHRVDAPVLEDGKRVNDGAGIDLTLADLHAGTWTGERTLLLLDGGVVVFMSPSERRAPMVRARLRRRSEWITFQAGSRHYGVQFLPMRCLDGYTSAQTAALEASEAYEVSLRVEEHPLVRVNVVAGHGMVVRDNAHHVLSAVVQGIVDWVQLRQPAYLYWFTGDTRQQRLLARLVRHHAALGGMGRLDADPFTGRSCVPEVFWLGREAGGVTDPAVDHRAKPFTHLYPPR